MCERKPKFKVGDIVVANNDDYIFTAKSVHFVGRVIEVYPERRTIDIETLHCDLDLPGKARDYVFDDLDEKNFDIKVN